DSLILFFGDYAGLNAGALRGVADRVIAGEFEDPLVHYVMSLDRGSRPDIDGVARPETYAEGHLQKIPFAVPARDTLPALDRYARIEIDGESRVAGHTQASRGCRHECNHCPIPPVYHGRFFVVPADIVLEDIRNQVKAGARHITFGDPDFLNGP